MQCEGSCAGFVAQGLSISDVTCDAVNLHGQESQLVCCSLKPSKHQQQAYHKAKT